MSIILRGLSKVFKSQNESVFAVAGIDLEIRTGEMLTILGPSGCGKTTTLRCIAGLEYPDAGEIHLNNNLIYSSSGKKFVPPNKRNIGMVFQSYALWPHMKVFDNVAYPLKMRRVPSTEIKERVQRVLRLVHCEALVGRYPNQLSGGQQQRIALARALVGNPEIILFDEPLSNLDAKLRESMRLEIVSIQKEIGFTGVFVTHDQVEAMVISDRIVVMQNGKIEQIGSPEEVYNNPGSYFVADFLGNLNLLEGTYRGDERYQTRVGIVQAKAAFTPEPGKGYSLGIRPEDITISEAAEKASAQKGGEMNCLAGVIKQQRFSGPNLIMMVQSDETRLRVEMGKDTILPTDSRVLVQWNPNRCMVFPKKT